jgi:hypothetical protein
LQHSQGDSNVTKGGAAALPQNNAAMTRVAAESLATGYITLSLPCGAQQRQNPAREGLANMLAILAAMVSASVAIVEDYKTINTAKKTKTPR